MLASIFYRRESPYDALIVGDFLRRVKRDIEVYL